MVIYLINKLLGRPSFVTYPFIMEPGRRRWRGTDRCPWDHPPLHPYQVYGGPLAPDEWRWKKEVWTNALNLTGYRLVMDAYSERLYHVWREG